METFSLLTSILVLVLMAVVIFLLFKKNQPVEKDDRGMLMLQQQISDLTKQLGTKIDQTTQHSAKMLQDQFMETSRISKDISEKLLKLEETNKQVVGFTDQLQQLQNILNNPKQRGILGEYFLETVLKNVLPPGSYKMQYRLGKDEKGNELIPDAVVLVKDKIIPIDAKFSLENYNRISEETNEVERAKLEKLFVNDLKARIKEVSKYIMPNKGTMDFAFMFIPHEAIYYDLLINKVGAMQDEDTNSLIQVAASKYKVIIVSPTSFLAYLQTVLQGLRALHIEETAQDIIKYMEQWQKHIYAYVEKHKKLGDQLSTVTNTYNLSNKELNRIDKDLHKITGKADVLDLEDVEKPRLE
ncbi:DNA recombination protein RmuC [Candidatus Parcubacteria bacterium]|nr:MAG: DNA recombination protein RmuC [Candidatus Parcubacteria bacterium]